MLRSSMIGSAAGSESSAAAEGKIGRIIGPASRGDWAGAEKVSGR
jgi:hypothetical protein